MHSQTHDALGVARPCGAGWTGMVRGSGSGCRMATLCVSGSGLGNASTHTGGVCAQTHSTLLPCRIWTLLSEVRSARGFVLRAAEHTPQHRTTAETLKSEIIKRLLPCRARVVLRFLGWKPYIAAITQEMGRGDRPMTAKVWGAVHRRRPGRVHLRGCVAPHKCSPLARDSGSTAWAAGEENCSPWTMIWRASQDRRGALCWRSCVCV